MFVGAEGTFVDEPAKATVFMVICKDDGNLSATEVRAKTDEYGVDVVLRYLSTHESVEIKPSSVEIARREQARRWHRRVLEVTKRLERWNGRMEQCRRSSVFPGRARKCESENHSRCAVVSMDVAAFCLDGGALPVRSKNETGSV